MATSEPTLTLYRGAGACSLVPHAMFHHLHLPFRSIPLEMNANGQYAAADGSFTHEEYVARINPTGFVPALDVGDGTIVTEMPALLSYIVNTAADRGQSADLLGKTPLEKAQVLQWLTWLSGTLHGQGFGALWRPARFVGAREDLYETVQGKGREIVQAGFSRIEKALDGKQYLVGESLTVADFNLYVFYRWGKRIGLEMNGAYPGYTRVMRAVETLEGLKKAIEVEGIKPCL
ncbi:glutathione S-transferase [Pestalotiopsis sp. NC0098]|nr:glutathione S-transferase [Pestalotiopsis sp. NC0098]